MKRFVLLTASLLALQSAFAGSDGHILTIDDRVPKFERFYADATAKPLDPDARFVLWHKDDGVAAVPPGPDGDAMARKLLDAAWEKYPTITGSLHELTGHARAVAQEMFARDNALFETQNDAIHTRLLLYVGQFDNNAFTIPEMNGDPATVVMPVETNNLVVALAHELAHSINMQLAQVKNSFGAPLGETVFLEGLAMRTSQQAVPGRPDAAYAAMPGEADWMAKCEARKSAILKGIAADLRKSGRDIGMKYTFGQGNTGLDREAYCAAWFATGDLLKNGWTLARLARVPEARMIDTIEAGVAGG